MNEWWGYLHTSGSVQVKRFFGQQDLDEANESPFVDFIHGPFKAKNREEAEKILKEAFGV